MGKLTFWTSLALICAIPGLFISFDSGVLGSANRLIGAASVFVWVVNLFLSKRIRRMTLFHLLTFAFAVWYAISLWWSVDPSETLFRLTLIQCVFLVSMIWDVYRTRLQIEAALQAFVIGGWISTITTLISFMHGSVTRPGDDRFAGGGFDPNDLALLIAMGVPLSVYLALYKKTTNWFLGFLNHGYVLCAGLTVLLTSSRGGLLAAVPGFLYFLFAIPKMNTRWRWTFGVVLAVAVLFVVKSDFSDQISRLGTIMSSSAGDRLDGRGYLWHGGWIAFSHHPWLGVGGGAFPTAAFAYSRSDEKLIAHDTYLSILVELGPVGIVLFFSILALVCRSIMRQPEPFKSVWATTILMWALGVGALSWEFRSQTWLFFVLIIACGNSEGLYDFANTLPKSRKSYSGLPLIRQPDALPIPSQGAIFQ